MNITFIIINCSQCDKYREIPAASIVDESSWCCSMNKWNALYNSYNKASNSVQIAYNCTKYVGNNACKMDIDENCVDNQIWLDGGNWYNMVVIDIKFYGHAEFGTTIELVDRIKI